MLELFSQAFATIFSTPANLALILLGVSVGVTFGILPGLTSVAALSMFLPLTFGMDLAIGISMLMGIYIGATSGGLVTSILMNIPGTPSSIATTFDGYPMAQKGEAGKALGITIFCSFIGTIVSTAALVSIAPALASVTIKFGPWENFAVTFFSLTLIAGLVGKSLTKGLISAILGVMIATVGMSPIDAAKRFTFGNIQLMDGFALVPVLVGLYAISEVLATASGAKVVDTTKIMDFKIRGLGFKFVELIRQTGNIIRACLVGIGIGVLPGVGAATSNFIAYAVVKKASKYPEKFGTGVVDGIVATETSNNAAIGGNMVPLLCLGIPGDASTALLLAGFMMQGVTPGPLLFQTHGPAVYVIFASMIVSSFLMMIVMYASLRGFVQILKIPSYFLMPVIVVLCIIGAYAVGFRTFDAWVLLIAGIAGLLMKKFDMPMPPLILGFILGEPFEVNLRRGLQHSNGDLTQLINHPIAIGFLALIVVFYAGAEIQKWLRRKKA